MTAHEEATLRALVTKWGEQGAPKGYSLSAYDEAMGDTLISVADELHDTLESLLHHHLAHVSLPSYLQGGANV